MSATADVVDEAERLARVKLSCGIEPGTPRIAALVSELDAGVVLDSSRRWPTSTGESSPADGDRDHQEGQWLP